VEVAAMLPRLRWAATESKDETELKWLRIALGQCGAPEVKEEILRMVEDTSLEVSLRAQARRAYVGAAGQEAVPILLNYMDDQTREPAWLAGPPLGIVAHDQLAMLRTRATVPSVADSQFLGELGGFARNHQGVRSSAAPSPIHG
jgi:hypothetical protein